MTSHARDRSKGLPRSFPVGATYVVEGRGGADGVFRVLSRYVMLPRGQRIDLPAAVERPSTPRALATRNARRSQIKTRRVGSRKALTRKKLATSSRGTARHGRR